MSHRPLLVLLLVSSLLLLAAGAPPTTVATDACGEPAKERDAGMAPWEDLCALSIGRDGSTLEVRVDVASTDRLTPTVLAVTWQQDGCTTRLLFGDASMGASAFSTIGRDCGDEGGISDCSAQVNEPIGFGVWCQSDYERVDLAAPSVEDGAYVWRIELDGAVEELFGPFEGAELSDFRTMMGRRANGRSFVGGPILCSTGGAQEVCWSALQDHMLGTGTLTLG